MDAIIIRFFHVDDERDRVDWIPDCLRTLFYNTYPEKWDEADSLGECESEEAQVYRFKLFHPNGKCFDVSYTLFESEDALRKIEDLSGAIFILDLMRMEGGALTQVGDRAYDILREKGVPVNNIFLLTAYEEKLPRVKLNGMPEKNILIKPIDPEILAKILLKTAEIFP